MSRSKSETFLKMLIDKGIVKKEDYEQFSDYEPEDDEKKFAEVIHQLFCQESHDGECEWYEEERKENTWQRGSHFKWIEKARRLKPHFDLILLAQAYIDYNKALREASISKEFNGAKLFYFAATGSDLCELIPEPLTEEPFESGAGHFLE